MFYWVAMKKEKARGFQFARESTKEKAIETYCRKYGGCATEELVVSPHITHVYLVCNPETSINTPPRWYRYVDEKTTKEEIIAKFGGNCQIFSVNHINFIKTNFLLLENWKMFMTEALSYSPDLCWVEKGPYYVRYDREPSESRLYTGPRRSNRHLIDAGIIGFTAGI